MDAIGRVFGRLTVIEDTGKRDKHRQIMWSCACECGNNVVVRTNSLTTGNTKSCGCLNTETRVAFFTTHDLSKHPLYSVWRAVIDRCTNTTHKSYANYGGRGITVCERWASLNNFIEDMQASFFIGGSLDRIDNNLGYFPGNCRWATMKEQGQNRRTCKYLEYKGVVKSMSAWSDTLGMPKHVLQQRIKKGWSLERALETPAEKYNKKEPIS